jgi:hypothetical protein
MKLLDTIEQESINKLCPYAQRLLEELRPLIENLDPLKISDGSKIEIVPLKNDWSLHIFIEPKDKNISALDVYASKSQCILGYAESEQIEDHTDPASDADSLIKQVVDYTAKYLNGVTVIEYYNRKNKLFMKKYYYGIDTENDAGKLIGTGRNFLWFFSKVHVTKKHSYKFAKS